MLNKNFRAPQINFWLYPLLLAFLLLVSYLALPAASQETPPPGPSKAEDFYPLQPGNFWTYQVDVEEEVESGASLRSLLFWRSSPRKTKINKYQASYTLRVVSIEDKVTHKVVTLKKEWLSSKRPWAEEDSEITYQLRGPEIIRERGDTTEVRYRFPLFLGARWGDRKQLERADLSYFYSAEKEEAVEVPAGKFPSCFWIIYRTRPDHTIEWFYPGVGVVKREYHHHSTILNTVETLMQYKVK